MDSKLNTLSRNSIGLRDPIRTFNPPDVTTDQSPERSHQRWPDTLATQTVDSKSYTVSRNRAEPRDPMRERKAFDVDKDESRARYYQCQPRTPLPQTLDSKVKTLSRNIHDLNFRLMVTGSRPSLIWGECLGYAMELTGVSKEFELELMANASAVMWAVDGPEKQKSRLAVWLEMNNDIAVLKGIVKGMAVELLRLEGIHTLGGIWYPG